MSTGWRVLRHGLVESTNECALAAVAEGSAQHGDVHVAEAQSGGRGRRGARWESAPGEGLFASFVLLPQPPGPPAPLATMGAGLALLDAVRELGLARARLDWPNDLVLGRAKLAGILVETRGLDPRRPHLVVGIGLNVRQERFSPELEAERAVTSLAREGLDVTLEQVLEALRGALRGRWGQMESSPADVAAAYLEAAGLSRGEVRVESAGGTHRGRVLALDLELGMQLRTDAGELLQLPMEHLRGVEPC